MYAATPRDSSTSWLSCVEEHWAIGFDRGQFVPLE
jgi:hypothetical protein